MKKKVVLVFPGQGSQYVGMGKEFYESSYIAKLLYDKANDILGYNIKSISFEGPEENLKDTSNTQPAIFLHSAVMWEIIREEFIDKIEILAAAGHSLGEYSALYSASVFSFEDGLKLVRKRGKLMSQVDPQGKGGMAAIIGLDPKTIESVCKEFTNNGKYFEPVNYNSPDQTVISGYKEFLPEIGEVLKQKGAKRVIELAVSGAFHSKLMEKVGEELKEFMKTIKIFKPSFTVFSNCTGKEFPESENEIIDLLSKQVYSPVLWTDIVKNISKLSPSLVIEVGPGQVLKGLISKTNSSLKIIATTNIKEIKKALIQ